MSTISIPSRYHAGIKKLMTASDATIESLVGAVGAAPPSINWEVLSEAVSPQVPELNRNDTDEMIEALVALYSVRESLGQQVEEFAEEIDRALQQLDNIGDVAADDKAGFRRRLAKLLSSNGS